MRRFDPGVSFVKPGWDTLMAWARGVERSFREVSDYATDTSTIERPFAVRCPGMMLLGAPTAAPTIMGAGPPPGSGGVEYAYNYESSFLGRQTNLSPASAAAPDLPPFDVIGARSVDPNIDLVNFFRRVQGGGDRDWLRTQQIANPNAGDAEIPADDTTIESMIADPVLPLYFEVPLWVCCGAGWSVRRVKIRWVGQPYYQSGSDLWEFQLRILKNGALRSGSITKPQTTEGVVLSARSIYNLPQANAVNGRINPVLDVALGENDTLLLSARGIGTLNPLPDFFAQVDVVRRVP